MATSCQWWNVISSSDVTVVPVKNEEQVPFTFLEHCSPLCSASHRISSRIFVAPRFLHCAIVWKEVSDSKNQVACNFVLMQYSASFYHFWILKRRSPSMTLVDQLFNKQTILNSNLELTIELSNLISSYNYLEAKFVAHCRRVSYFLRAKVLMLVRALWWLHLLDGSSWWL